MNRKVWAFAVVVLITMATVPCTMSDAAIISSEPAIVSGEAFHEGGRISYEAIRDYGQDLVRTDSGRLLFKNVNMSDYATCKIFDSDKKMLVKTENIPAFGIPFAVAADLEPGEYTVTLIGMETKAERQWIIEIADTYSIVYTDGSIDLASVTVESGDESVLPDLTSKIVLDSGRMSLKGFDHWDLAASPSDDSTKVPEHFMPTWNTQMFAIWGDEAEYTVEYMSSFIL